jgi:hypothetical protein
MQYVLQSSQNNLVELSNDYDKYNLNESNTLKMGRWYKNFRRKGTYEWWYFDAHLMVVTIVIVFLLSS